MEQIARIFSPQGPLAAALKGYQHREEQANFAQSVARTLLEGGILLAEAGTGTGKTLAYLIPAALSGKKVVVSTATKTLQTQILERDLPLIEAALDKKVASALLKGRENYLCLRRFKRYSSQMALGVGNVADLLYEWAKETKTGDRGELSSLPEDFDAWRQICATSESCLGQKCREYEQCHLMNARKKAARAQIVVVNHHLFFADLSVRAQGGEVIPSFSAVIFDEAHHIEQVATQYFGIKVSSGQTVELLKDATPLLAGRKKELSKSAAQALEAVENASYSFWSLFGAGQAAVRLKENFDGEPISRLARLCSGLEQLLATVKAEAKEGEELDSVEKRGLSLLGDLRSFMEPPKAGEVRWAEARGRFSQISSVPVEIGPTLAEKLFSGQKPVVLTSATLRVGGSFDYIAERLKIPPDAAQITIEGPFDYKNQCLLYVPESFPDPAAPNFPKAVAEEIQKLLSLTNGRAFCLFTSHRVLREVAAKLALSKLGFTILVQGDAPREVLLEKFREDIHSVLLGAQAFWEGVDVPGEALSAVIIDKLPFMSPGDPLVEARIEKIAADGHSAFNRYQLPMAAMALRQGVGRLIRSTDDRGVVAVLDTRLLTKGYGSFIRRSLPLAPITRNINDIAIFFSKNRPVS